MSGEDGDGGPRVSIPDALRLTIKGIKEIAVNYSDEDIYGMLKECNMDSDQTTQKLLYFDTFQVVKSKRKPRVIRDGSDDQYSYTDNYNGGGRKFNSNIQRRPRKFSPPVPTKESSSNSSAMGSSSNKVGPQPAKLNGIKGDKDGKSRNSTNTSTAGLRDKLNGIEGDKDGKSGNTSTPAPTSTPITNTSTAGPSDRKERGSSKPKQSKLGNGAVPPSASGSGLCPASDPVLEPSLNVKNSPPVGTIKRETTKNQDVSRPVDLTSSSTQSQVNEMSEEHCSKNASSELEVKPRQSVIFPAHFHVPENFKSALSFGSFESNNEGSSDPSVPEASPIPQSSSPMISGHDDYPDQSTHAPLNLTSSEEEILSGALSGADLRYDQSEQEMVQPPNGSLLGYGSSVPSNGSLQGIEIQTTDATPSPIQQTTGTTPSDAAQPKLRSPQSSVPASPHVYPAFRDTYPANYMPYGPYYPAPVYVPQNVPHHLLGHNGYPHQPSASDLYNISPKFPGFKSGSMTHFGTPSVYGSSGSFPDDMRNELKEKNLLPNNLQLQGLGNSFPGMYHHSSQSIPTQPLHQSQASPAVHPSLASYPQQQMVWDKKV